MTRKRKRASISYNEEGEEEVNIEEDEVLVKDEPVTPPGEPADDTAPPTTLEAEADEVPDERAELDIKQMKPDVSLSYQGEQPYRIAASTDFRIWHVLSSARPHH